MRAIDFISGCRGEPCRAGDIGLVSGSCVSRRFQIDDDSVRVVLRYETGRCVAFKCLDAPPETISNSSA
jgi:hypothetical protein